MRTGPWAAMTRVGVCSDGGRRGRRPGFPLRAEAEVGFRQVQLPLQLSTTELAHRWHQTQTEAAQLVLSVAAS